MRNDTAYSPRPANIINHIALVIDESYSMKPHRRSVVEVVDGQVKHLARRSQELDQETRITVYTFSSPHLINCLIYDKDVLRMPSISGMYHPDNNTALCKATLLALDDLAMTPEKYGEHSFLVYVITDGQENSSGADNQRRLPGRLTQLPDHWTVGVFVPDQNGVFEAKRFGFPAANIAVWDTANAEGFAEVGETIRQTSDAFMEGRTRGVRGSRSLFSLNDVTTSEVQQSLLPLTPGSYTLHDVGYTVRIDEFVQDVTRRSYQAGKAFYELTKAETIQPQKVIAIQAEDGRVYSGAEARQLLKLPDAHVRVRPGHKQGCTIFVQSTSYNRKLIGGTRLLLVR